MSITVSNTEEQDRRDMQPGVNGNGLGLAVEYCANGCNDIVVQSDWGPDSRYKGSKKTEEIMDSFMWKGHAVESP